MQVLKSVLSVLGAAFVLAACNNVDFKKTKAGVPYKIFSNGKGDSIRQNNIVKFEVIRKTKDTVLFSSYDQKMPQYLQVQAVPEQLSYSDIGGNLMEIFTKAKKGDSIYITESADSLLKANPQMAAQAPIKKGDQIITTLKILEVYKSPEEAQAAVNKDRAANADKMDKDVLEQFKKDTAAQAQLAKDNKIIEDYLAKNNIQTQKTDWGVYIQVLDPGQGPKPKAGQFANVKYSGRTLAGKAVDAGVYPLQVGLGGSIKGFDEGVKQLAKGGRATVFIPSTLGYGPGGSAPKVAPNENLIFDLEILDISDTPPAAQPPVATDTTGAQRR
jgi:FKBP-type peptidyl-prolyl cis-trans isomerase FkpA